MYEIEKEIPIPRYPPKYPFKEMEVGDSFLAESDRENYIRCRASNFGKKSNKKFSVRKQVNGIRVWRTK